MKTRNLLILLFFGARSFLWKGLIEIQKLNFNSYLIILLLGVSTFASTNSLAQSVTCGFDDYLDTLYAHDPQMRSIFWTNDLMMGSMFEEDSMAIMACDVYTIPVVVHIINLGESEGTGSNISDSQIESAIEDLNDQFSNLSTLSVDICIQFCLAQRDPDGNSTDGIIRVNGYNTCEDDGCYQNIGITRVNESAIKNLSRWPNRDYLNIWIVSEINNNNAGAGVQGYATFPGSDYFLDGIVILYNAFGTTGTLKSYTDQNKVLVHEVGHFFSLYHTFEGDDDGNDCPENDVCSIDECPGMGVCIVDGDHLCDTPPHIRSDSDCNENGTNSCDGNSSNEEFVHNYMDYSNEDCRFLFTEDQRIRMRCSLMSLRESLTYSLGCFPACNTVTSAYTPEDLYIEIGETATFTNNSTNGESFIWRLDAQIISTTTDLTYTFNASGIFELCLDALDEQHCINRYCTEITVYPICNLPLNECEIVENGNFEQVFYYPFGNFDWIAMCGWQKTNSSPFICSQPDNTLVGMWIQYGLDSWLERITSEAPLNLEPGLYYEVSFDYYVIGSALEAIQIALTDSDNEEVLPITATIIAEAEDPAFDEDIFTVHLYNHNCHPAEAIFSHHNETFEYNDDGQLYLNITAVPKEESLGGSVVYIDNLSISKCNPLNCSPNPDFTTSIDSCEVSFFGENTGDPGEYRWDFGDGSNGSGENVIHQYMWPGTFDVCLIIECEEFSAEAICKEVEIPEYCDFCYQLPPLISRQCNDEEDTVQTFIANLEFEIPNGYFPCDSMLFVWCDEVHVVVNSYSIDSFTSNTNLVKTSLYLFPPDGFDIESDSAHLFISFCDSTGNMICYKLSVIGDDCDYCFDVEDIVTAECNLALGDSISTFVYDGNFVLDIGVNLPFLEALSPEVGFSVDNATQISSTEWSFDFSITTSDINFTETSAMFVFERASNPPIYFCFEVQFAIDTPCPSIPVECKSNWTKSVWCSQLDDQGLVVFPTGLMSIPIPEGYTFCNDEPMVFVDDPYLVEVIGMEIIDDFLWFDIAIHADQDSFGREAFVRFIFCNERGDTMICQGIWFKLKCNMILPRSTEFTRIEKNIESQLCRVFPNPVSESLEIQLKKFSQAEVSIMLIDIFGKSLHSEGIPQREQRLTLEVNSFMPGIYFLVVIQEGRIVETHKIAVIHD